MPLSMLGFNKYSVIALIHENHAQEDSSVVFWCIKMLLCPNSACLQGMNYTVVYDQNA